MNKQYFSYDGVEQEIRFHNSLDEARGNAHDIADAQYNLANETTVFDDDDGRINDSCFGVVVGKFEMLKRGVTDEEREELKEYGECHEQIIEPPKLVEYPQNNGWIKCSERLPEISDEVPLSDEYLVIGRVVQSDQLGIHVASISHVGNWFDNGGNMYEVTHWMRLPEPPKH
ncbi:DUF551 domain-containing protein [Testudinibacter sp. P80/BLE/0925]